MADTVADTVEATVEATVEETRDEAEVSTNADEAHTNRRNMIFVLIAYF